MSSTSITLSNGPTTLELDEDLYWSDELDWQPIAQTEERSVTGALIVQAQAMVAGRPITLEPEDDESAWMPRAVVDQLRAWAAVPDLQLMLTLRGVPRLVLFRRQGGPAVTAHPVVHYSDTDIVDPYLCTVRFLEK